MKKKSSRKRRIKKEFLIEDESYTLQKSKGNGILRRQIWCDSAGEVTRYSLTYINTHFFSGDHGRVLGYDNAHGFHHRHYLDKVEAVHFKSFVALEQQFQQEFEAIHDKIRKKIKKK